MMMVMIMIMVMIEGNIEKREGMRAFSCEKQKKNNYYSETIKNK